MPERTITSMEHMESILRRLPRDDAEAIMRDAAIRAEAVADYVERTAKSSRTVTGKEAARDEK